MKINDKKKRLRKKADRLYQEIGRQLYDKCLICGGEYSCLHHYHLKSTCSALRYNLKNGIPICASCHYRLHASGDPTYNEIILKKKGQEWADELQEIKKNTLVKTTIKYYEEVINELKKIYDNNQNL